MGLIICPRCSRKVSDKLSLCPKCGYPINEDKTIKERLIVEKERLLKEKMKTLEHMMSMQEERSAFSAKPSGKRTWLIIGTVVLSLIILTCGVALTLKESTQSKFEEEYKRRFHEVPGYNRHNDGVGERHPNSEHFNHVSMDQVRIAQSLIRAAGYKCDTCDEMLPFFLGGGFTVHCNNWQYTYEIRDVGGTLRVTVK